MTAVIGSRYSVLGGLATVALWSAMLGAQQQQAEPQATQKAPKPYEAPRIFAASWPLELTITAPIRQLRRDRAEQTPWRTASISYHWEGAETSVPVRLRTRGIWRKKNCDIPPLLMNFAKDSVKGTLFAKLDRLRLSLHCRDTDDYEQYVLQEFNLYRVQRLLTPLSFEVRLARVTYVDSEKKDTVARRWAFVQEQDEPFASRAAATLVTTEGAGPQDLDPYESAFTGVFQYFVANSDFSIRALHNIVLIYRDERYVPVARDFDWSGAVNARYATPNPVLPIRTVRQRLMRGYCAPAAEYEKVFALFRAKKDAIYALYADSIGALLKPSVVKNTLWFFDEFYETINDPRKAKKEIVEACLGGSA
jgi:hypothetical protein